MATSSSIGYETENGGCIAVYCHYDCFPRRMIPILNDLTYDETKNMVENALVDGGLRVILDDGTYQTYEEPCERSVWLYDTAFANINRTNFAYFKRKDGTLFVTDSSGRDISSVL